VGFGAGLRGNRGSLAGVKTAQSPGTGERKLRRSAVEGFRAAQLARRTMNEEAAAVVPLLKTRISPRFDARRRDEGSSRSEVRGPDRGRKKIRGASLGWMFYGLHHSCGSLDVQEPIHGISGVLARPGGGTGGWAIWATWRMSLGRGRGLASRNLLIGANRTHDFG